MVKNYVNLILSIGGAVFLLLISPLVCEAELLTVLPIESLNEGFFIGEDMRTCEVEGCNNKHRAKGLCEKHWKKQYRKDHKEEISKYIKQWRLVNKEHIIKYDKQYNQDNRERVNNRHRQYNQDNKKHIAEWNKQYRLDNSKHIKQYRKDNREHLTELNKQYYKDNKEFILKQARQWRQDNKEHAIEWHKKYRQTLAGKVSGKTSRARYRALTKDLTKETVQRVYEDNIKKYGVLTCYLCFKPIVNNEDSLDHSTPLARQGTNDYENLGIAHKHCNYVKHTKTLEEWYAKFE